MDRSIVSCHYLLLALTRYTCLFDIDIIKLEGTKTCTRVI